MTNVRRLSAVIGVLATTGVLSAGLVACSSDTSGVVPDGGADVGTKPDAGADTSVRDTGSPDHFTSKPDTWIADAGTDTFVADSGHDSGRDAPLDAPRDAAADVLAAEEAFPNAINQAYCQRLNTCCASTAFEVAECVKDLTDSELTVTSNVALIFGAQASPHHGFNQAQAAKCLAEIGALACGDNSAATMNQVTQDCAAAYVPDLHDSDPGCRSSFDCPTNTFCAPINSVGATVAPDGGTCVALLGLNAPCTDTFYSSDCTYLGGPIPSQYCGPNDGGTNVCQQAQANGTACNTFAPTQCVSEQCIGAVDGGSFTCSPTFPLTHPFAEDYCARWEVDGG